MSEIVNWTQSRTGAGTGHHKNRHDVAAELDRPILFEVGQAFTTSGQVPSCPSSEEGEMKINEFSGFSPNDFESGFPQ